MANQVILKKSSVAARVPVAGDLAFGELALNYQDGLLFYKKADSTIGSIGSIGSGSSGSSAAISNVTRNYTGTGSLATFTVTTGVSVDSVIVTENGLVQTPTTDYTVSGSTLTFVTAPAVGINIQIRELGSTGSLDNIIINSFLLMGA
jgi:hypothetical protein